MHAAGRAASGTEIYVKQNLSKLSYWRSRQSWHKCTLVQEIDRLSQEGEAERRGPSINGDACEDPDEIIERQRLDEKVEELVHCL